MFWFRSDNWLRYRNVCASVLVSLTLLLNIHIFSQTQNITIKWVWHEIFCFRFFFTNQFPPCPKIAYWSHLEFLRKFAGNNGYRRSFIAGVVDTGDEYKVVNISENFHKNSKWLYLETQGPGGNWYMKYLKSKISCQTSFKV